MPTKKKKKSKKTGSQHLDVKKKNRLSSRSNSVNVKPSKKKKKIKKR